MEEETSKNNMEETNETKVKDETCEEINPVEKTEETELVSLVENVSISNEKNVEVSDAGSVHSKECPSDNSHKEIQSNRTPSLSEHSCSDSEASVILEREEGDGEESLPPKKVDDDEDKKNPQYIPKRGTFYEHDDRTAEDIEELEEEESKEKTEKDGKKKVWQDKKEKWNHDRFNDNEQAPKSKQELVSIYGYDIRSEDGPPRARRRRRYGRGPNKYTRNWEDEDAYSKPPLRTRRTPRKKTPSNSLDGSRDNDSMSNEESTERIDRTPENGKKDVEEEEKSPVNKEIIRDTHASNYNNNSFGDGNTSYNNNKSQKVGSGRVSKPKREIKRGDDYSGFTRARNFETRKDQRIVPKHVKKDDYIQSQNFTNRSNGKQQQQQEVEKEMSKLSINETAYGKGNKYNGGQRQVSMPPRLQNEQKGSKRYSSIRQRSLPETANPSFGQHSNFYPNEFNQQQSNVTQPQQQPSPQQQQQPPNPGIVHANQMPQIPPPPLPALPQQVPATSAPILQAPPPQFAPTFPQPPPNFLQPGVAPPPPFIPPQTTQIINYVQGQPQFPQAPFQGYQQQFNTVSQPAELYQPQGGITYYSPQEQQHSQRSLPPAKRRTSAIPIIPPPPLEPNRGGRGRAGFAEETDGVTTNNGGNQDDNNHGFEDAPSAAVAVKQ